MLYFPQIEFFFELKWSFSGVRSKFISEIAIDQMFSWILVLSVERKLHKLNFLVQMLIMQLYSLE